MLDLFPYFVMNIFNSYYSFLLIVFLSLLILPIIVDEISLKYKHYWTGVILSGLFFLLEILIIGLLGADLDDEQTGDLIFVIITDAWLFMIFSIIQKPIWWKGYKSTGMVSGGYRFRYLFAFAGYMVLSNIWPSQTGSYFMFGLPVIDPVFYGLMTAPFFALSQPYVWFVIPGLIILSYLIHRLESGKLPPDQRVSLKLLARNHWRAGSVTLLGVLILTRIYLPDINYRIDDQIVGIEGSIRQSIPGQPRFQDMENVNILDGMMVFEGRTINKSANCECVYAVDMTTRDILWSTESLAPLSEQLNQEDQPNLIDHYPDFSIVAISDDRQRVYVDVYRRLYAMDVQTGAVLWQRNTSDFSESQYFDETIIIESEDAGVEGIDVRNGKAIWKVDLHDYDIGEITVVPDRIVLVGLWDETAPVYDESKLAVSLDTGETIWKYYFRGYESFSVIQDGIFSFVDYVQDGPDSFLGAVDTRAGAVLWNQVLEADSSSMERLFADRERIYLYNSYEQQHQTFFHLTALDARSGQQLWQTPEELVIRDFKPMLTEPGLIVVSDQNRKISSLDVSTGQVIWSKEYAQSIEDYYATDKTFVSISSHQVAALDAVTGTKLWQKEYTLVGPKEFVYGPNPFSDKILLSNETGVFALNTGIIVKVDLRTGQELWQWSRATGRTLTYDLAEGDNDHIVVYNVGDHNHVFILSQEGTLLFDYYR